ncbi:MAG TPA: hypothetical protein ENI23_12575 [bacterium]|nr:hypothetical protein [bacterium]
MDNIRAAKKQERRQGAYRPENKNKFSQRLAISPVSNARRMWEMMDKMEQRGRQLDRQQFLDGVPQKTVLPLKMEEN